MYFCINCGLHVFLYVHAYIEYCAFSLATCCTELRFQTMTDGVMAIMIPRRQQGRSRGTVISLGSSPD